MPNEKSTKSYKHKLLFRISFRDGYNLCVSNGNDFFFFGVFNFRKCAFGVIRERENFRTTHDVLRTRDFCEQLNIYSFGNYASITISHPSDQTDCILYAQVHRVTNHNLMNAHVQIDRTRAPPSLNDGERSKRCGPSFQYTNIIYQIPDTAGGQP